MSTQPHPVAFWNDRYQATSWAYGNEPNLFFKAVLDSLPFQGRLLLAGEGDGRNALYAARLGWEVHAFDWSEVARDKTLQAAQAEGLTIHYEVASATSFTTSHSMDLVASIFFHLPPDVRATAHARLISVLKPGGMMLLEAFDLPQLGFQSGGPRDEALLYSCELLQNDFSSLTTVSLTAFEAELSEGPFHSGPAALVRYTGIKPFPFL